ERHQSLAAFRKLSENLVDLFGRIACQEKGNGGGEGKGVRGGAVEADESAAAQGEVSQLNRAFRALLCRSIAVDPVDARVCNERDVEVHGFFRLPFEHQAWCNLL